MQDVPTLTRLSLYDCANMTPVSALAIICACSQLWSTGALDVVRCAQLGVLTVRPRRLALPPSPSPACAAVDRPVPISGETGKNQKGIAKHPIQTRALLRRRSACRVRS